MDAINETRLRVWAQQPDEFFEEAFVDADGTMVPTDAECKEGVDIDHNGDWGYQAGLISLANTAEPLYLINRSGNRPSHEQMDVYLDKAIALCRRAGFRRITLRGDTDFSQTKHLDRWDQPGDICFIFGIDTRRKSQGVGPKPSGPGIQRPGTTTQVCDQDRAPPTARAGQGRDRSPAEV